MIKLRIVLGLLALASIISVHSIDTRSNPISTRRRRIVTANGRNVVPIHKVLLTQRGYIQFLLWKLPVPKIEEFTFCLWVKSANLTYSHSIFSYSKDERDRLIRSWISPFGRSVHLEIGSREIFAHPVLIEEHRWYHLCQSWENVNGQYGLWMDGHIETFGRDKQTVGHVVPPDGDIVVGQEYTDFDKGLDDGIEGAIFGFNLLLISAFGSPDTSFQGIQKLHGITTFPIGLLGVPRIEGLLQIGPEFEMDSPIRLRRSPVMIDVKSKMNFDSERIAGSNEQNIPDVRGKLTGNSEENLFDRDRIDFRKNRKANDSDVFEFFENRLEKVESGRTRLRENSSNGGDKRRPKRSKINPVGLQLIELTYEHCEIGRGSPFIGGSRMLVSWTRTPVKIFGGAIVKNAKNNCGHF